MGLLAVASEHLEDWVEPETAQNRVFLRNGRLHLIPPNAGEGVPESALVSVDRLKDSHACGKPIQTALEEWLHKSKALFEDPGPNNHQAPLMVPLKAARVLEAHPNILPQAVESFYLRDLI